MKKLRECLGFALFLLFVFPVMTLVYCLTPGKDPSEVVDA